MASPHGNMSNGNGGRFPQGKPNGKGRPLDCIQKLDFSKPPRRAMAESPISPNANSPSPALDMIRSHSSGKLKFSPEEVYEFTAEQLEDFGEIGQGAFGTVNKMRYKKEPYTVMAVKRIHSTMDKSEEKKLLMDLDVIMKSDECPYIVKFYGAIFTEGDCWICMELMDSSLEKLYKIVYEKLNEQIPEEILGKIAVATLNALIYLKDKHKIIHRDVKPSNILLDRKGHIKLCDFGIAGQLVDSIALTRDAGCRPYMAPERIDPSKANCGGYDIRSDVWSLGITLVEVATGRFPYPHWNCVFDQLQQVVQGDAPILSDNRFSIEFHTFVNSCLTKDENLRPKYVDGRKGLVEFAWIKKYADAPVDVGGYVSRILDSAAALGHIANGPGSTGMSRLHLQE